MRHVVELARRLGVPRSMCRSAVVFPQRARLVKVPAATGDFAVIQAGALWSFAARWLQTGPDRIRPQKLERVHRDPESLSASTEGQREAHVRMAKRAEALRKRKQERRRERDRRRSRKR